MGGLEADKAEAAGIEEQRRNCSKKPADGAVVRMLSHSTSAPVLTVAASVHIPREDLSTFTQRTCFVPGPHAKADPLEVVAGTVHSFGEVWDHVTEAPVGAKPRTKFFKDLHVYFQGAASRLSHDIPLLQRSHSMLAAHSKLCRHKDALRR